MNYHDLKDKKIKLYMVGGLEFLGLSEFVSEKTVVLRTFEGLLIVDRKNIIATLIINEELSEEINDFNNNDYLSQEMPQGIIDNYYGSIIPEDMLVGESDKNSVDLSVSFFNTKKKGYTNDSSQKDFHNREEDSE